MYDVAIIGAGVSGCATARELSRYDASVIVLEKEEDVCCGTSKANSAVVHAGFDPEPGTLMAELNVRGNEMMGPLARDLDIPFVRNGSLVVCLDASRMGELEALLERGRRNGVKGLRIVGREELVRMEPNISDDAVAALFAPTGGIVCPFTLTIALAENAFENGVGFMFDSEVRGIERIGQHYSIATDDGRIDTRCIVNAAGVQAGRVHNMVSKDVMRIVPRKGEYCLLDAGTGTHVRSTVFMLPGEMGKGILVTPTTSGNLLIGPTAEDKDGTDTTAEGIRKVIAGSAAIVKDIPYGNVITSFAGIRAHHPEHRFVIGEVDDAPLFFDCAGIESPGLTSAPAIGAMLSEMVAGRLGLRLKDGFRPTRKGIVRPLLLPDAERKRFIRDHPEYGTVVCRCNMVTYGEILDAIHRPLGARSLDGVKRRTTAGMGRCQAGFCSPRVIDIIEDEVPTIGAGNVTKKGKGSEVLVGRIRGVRWTATSSSWAAGLRGSPPPYPRRGTGAAASC